MATAYKGQAKGRQRRTAGHPSGLHDVAFDLISTLYHSTEAAEKYAKYREDAEQSGENEVADFFREFQEEEHRRITRAKELLRDRIGEETGIFGEKGAYREREKEV